MSSVQIKRYFIGIIPPPVIVDEVTSIKNAFMTNYQTKAALRSPPHITLHMPFEWKEPKEAVLIDYLGKFLSTRPAFPLTLSGFGCFEPRVIFVLVKENNELHALQKESARFCKMKLNLFHPQYQDLPFHPHITLAFRDLKKSDFPQAWAELRDKPFLREFEVKSISLLKHDGKLWKTHHSFHLLS
jgi:2'-5' RNA ligase